jgi:beta-lactamase regulating signal transducer with metallopeptidase domain
MVDGSFLWTSGAAWIGFLLNLVTKSLLALAVAHAFILLMGRWPAALRSRTWTLVFCALLALPLVLILPPEVKVAGLMNPIVNVVDVGATKENISLPAIAKSAANNFLTEELSTREAGKTGTANLTSKTAASSVLSFGQWFTLVMSWLLGVVWYAARTARCYRSGLSAAKSARPVSSKLFHDTKHQMKIRGSVELRASESVTVPFVTGITRRYLVLPATVLHWTGADQRAVFQHELAHIRRHDLLRLIVFDLVCAFYWFNPLARTAARRAKLDIEMSCDDLACGEEGTAAGYARRLLWFARRAPNARGPEPTPGMAQRAGLERRIRYILDTQKYLPAWKKPARKSAAFILPALVLLILIPVTTVQIVAMNGPDQDRGGETAVALTHQTAHEPTAGSLSGGGSAPDLFVASATGNLATVANILEQDPGLLNAQTQRGMTPLAVAAWNDQLDVVEYLITRGADLDVKNHNGLTPLFCAVDRSRRSMTRLLVGAGANLTTRGYLGRTLLHMAARSGDTKLVRTLIDQGARVNARDASGVTPLDLAVWHRKPSVASILTNQGAVRSSSERPSFFKLKNGKPVV